MLDKVKKFVVAKIEAVLDEFVDCDFEQKDIFSGTLVMSNLSLKSAAIDLINAKLPFAIESIQVRSVSLKLPWDALTREPTDVRVQGVMVVGKLRQFRKPPSPPAKRTEPKPGLGSFVTRLINQLIDMVQVLTLPNADPP